MLSQIKQHDEIDFRCHENRTSSRFRHMNSVLRNTSPYYKAFFCPTKKRGTAYYIVLLSATKYYKVQFQQNKHLLHCTEQQILRMPRQEHPKFNPMTPHLVPARKNHTATAPNTASATKKRTEGRRVPTTPWNLTPIPGRHIYIYIYPFASEYLASNRFTTSQSNSKFLQIFLFEQ